jgi:hypothetical protein
VEARVEIGPRGGGVFGQESGTARRIRKRGLKRSVMGNGKCLRTDTRVRAVPRCIPLAIRAFFLAGGLHNDRLLHRLRILTLFGETCPGRRGQRFIDEQRQFRRRNRIDPIRKIPAFYLQKGFDFQITCLDDHPDLSFSLMGTIKFNLNCLRLNQSYKFTRTRQPLFLLALHWDVAGIKHGKIKRHIPDEGMHPAAPALFSAPYPGWRRVSECPGFRANPYRIVLNS